MNRHERRKAAAKKQRPKIVNFPDDTAPHEGAYLFRWEVTWLQGEMAALHYKELLLYAFDLTKPKPPQCYVCNRDMGYQPGRWPWWVGVLHRVSIPNSAADPRRYSEALANPPEFETQEKCVCLVGICGTCCRPDGDPNEMFRKRTLADQGKRGILPASEAATARFSPTSGRA